MILKIDRNASPKANLDFIEKCLTQIKAEKKRLKILQSKIKEPEQLNIIDEIPKYENNNTNF